MAIADRTYEERIKELLEANSTLVMRNRALQERVTLLTLHVDMANRALRRGVEAAIELAARGEEVVGRE